MAFIKHITTLFLLSMLLSVEYYFDSTAYNDGSQLPYPKAKHGAEERGEDSLVSSQVAIVVCDGVGGSPFSSKHISSYLADSFQELAYKVTLETNVAKFSARNFYEYYISGLHNAIGRYRKQLTGLYQDWASETKKSPPFNVQSLSASSTLIGAVIVNLKDGPRIRIIQKGDSLAVVFRRFESELAKGMFFYLPVYRTADQQYSFNFPHQFTDFLANYDDEVFTDEFKVQEGDQVLVGSDGLFDNVPLGLLTILVNHMAKFGLKSPEETIERVKKLTAVFDWVLKRKRWVVEEWFKNRRLYSIEDENNSVSLPDKTTGRSWYNFVHNVIPFTTGSDRPAEDQADLFKNDLKAMLVQLIREKGVPVAEANAWAVYLRCPVIKMLSISDKKGYSAKHLRGCVKSAIESQFSAETVKIDEFEKTPRANVKSDVLTAVAKVLSENLDYPSPFALHAWKEGLRHEAVPTGKPDDISVILAGVRPVKPDTREALKFMQPMYAEIKSRNFALVKQDLDVFLNFFHAQAIAIREEMRRKDAEAKLALAARLEAFGKQKSKEAPQWGLEPVVIMEKSVYEKEIKEALEMIPEEAKLSPDKTLESVMETIMAVDDERETVVSSPKNEQKRREAVAAQHELEPKIDEPPGLAQEDNAEELQMLISEEPLDNPVEERVKTDQNGVKKLVI